MASISVAPRKSDIARFETKAARGEIPDKAVRPLALVFAAVRKAQAAIGTGQDPLETISDEVGQQDEDIARFAAKAARGEIPHDAVKPLAHVFTAMRKAQVAIGPGHKPLDAIFEALPEQYASNWLRKKTGRN